MTENPLDLFNQTTTGEAAFEKLYVYDKLIYDFNDDEITVRKLNVTGISSFTSDVTFSGDITLDEITARNANVTGVATVGADLYLSGKLFDGDGDFGTSGQLLASDGTDTVWIDASTTSVANANNVGVNANSTNADQFITFVGASSGNNPIRVDTDLKYNPSTNTLKTSSGNLTFSSGGDVIVSDDLDVTGNLDVSGNLKLDGQLKDGDGNFGSSGQLLSSDGTDTEWINAGALTAGAAAEVGVNQATANADHFITMVDTASGNENIRVDTDLKYNPVTNTLTATNFAGSGANLTGIVGVPSGCILLWSGAANAIPSGFVLCNGQNSTPDLRGRFIVGYSDTDNDYDVNDTGGSKDNTLSVSQLPSHTHTASVSDPGHQHDTSVTNTKLFPSNGQTTIGYGGPGQYPATVFTMSNANTGISVSNSSTGSGGAIENRPPYYALCYIMKT